ncbi:mechanosensitive ion channel family protein [bacterium]|nr:mechanosensitive ion channel family protein [bacterium]
MDLSELLQHDHVIKVVMSLPWKLIFQIFINLFILVIICKIIDKIASKFKENLLKADRVQFAKMLPFIAKLTKLTIIFLAIAAFLQSQGYSVNSFLAGFGITGLAVGFAANEALSDIFGSFSVITDKVFRVGDYIGIGSDEGTVEDINFRSTRLRKLDDTVVTIPNRKVASVSIINYSRIKHRMIDETFSVEYGTSDKKLAEAIEIIKNIAEADEHVMTNYQVFIDKLNDSSIDVRFIAYLKTNQLVAMRKIKSDLILKIVEQYRAAKINFAFPSMSVYMEK